jgi:hypothetical protein
MRCAKRGGAVRFGLAHAFTKHASARRTWDTEQRDTNMKILKNLVLALSVAAVLGSTGLYAQTAVVANVPFDFTVQTVRLTSGEYTLRPTSITGDVIQITNRETGESILVRAPSMLSTYKGKESESGKLIFHRYGNRYFFSEVWTANGLRGRANPSKQEREIQASNSEKQVALVSIPLAGAGQ